MLLVFGLEVAGTALGFVYRDQVRLESLTANNHLFWELHVHFTHEWLKAAKFNFTILMYSTWKIWSYSCSLLFLVVTIIIIIEIILLHHMLFTVHCSFSQWVSALLGMWPLSEENKKFSAKNCQSPLASAIKIRPEQLKVEVWSTNVWLQYKGVVIYNVKMWYKKWNKVTARKQVA